MQIEVFNDSHSKLAILARPDDQTVSAKLLVVCHGAGLAWAMSNDLGLTPGGDPISPEAFRLSMRYLTEHGYAVLCPSLFDLSLYGVTGTDVGQTWGNDESTTQLANVIADVRAMPHIAGASKYALMGISMGNATMLNHVRRAGQTAIAGLIGIVPLPKLSDLRGTYAAHGVAYAQINAAHYATSPAGTVDDSKFNTYVVPTYDPMSIAASVTVPYALWSNKDDTTCPPADIDTLAALVSGTVDRRNLGTGGHTVANVRGDDLVEYLDRLSW